MRKNGPLVHEPTGIEALDEVTDGGPVYGSRWGVAGAPDAGKTALAMQVADVYARRGIAVGVLAVDEEPSDITMRLMQRAGWSRGDCERREHRMLVAMEASTVAELPIRMYDATWTIDRAAADLAAWARQRGDRRAALFVDSIQTVTCDAEASMTSLREAVTARMHALRRAAEKHQLIAITTSEMARGAYRSEDAAEAANDLRVPQGIGGNRVLAEGAPHDALGRRRARPDRDPDPEK